MSSWNSFRQHWLKPDIYPLIAVMTGALTLGSVSFIHTAHNPTVHWDSTERRQGVRPGLGQGYTPFVARFKNKPSTVFEKNNGMWDTLAEDGKALDGIVFVVSREMQEESDVELEVPVEDEGEEVVQQAIDEAVGLAAAVGRGPEVKEVEERGEKRAEGAGGEVVV